MCLPQRCVATTAGQLGLARHGTARHGMENTLLSLLLRNRHVYRFPWLDDSFMA
jgi:hypothetical protein